MASVAQAVANLRRSAFQPRYAAVTSIVGDGSVMVQYAGSDPVPAWLTDATTATVAVGHTVVLHPINSTLLVAATISTPHGPSLLPNGNFALPGDGLPPYGWQVQAPVGGDYWQLLASAAAAPPGHASSGVLQVATMANAGGITTTSVAFLVDPATTYRLTAMVKVDPTISAPTFAPYLSCMSAAPNSYPVIATNGSLTPVPTASWQSYTTTLTTAPDASTATVNLVFNADPSSYGAISIAAVTLQ